MPFYIESNISFQERRLRTLKHGHAFAVFDHRGDIVAWSSSSDGTHHHDTRYLSRIEHRLNSAPLLLLSSNVEEDNAALTVDLDNPGMVSRGLGSELVHVKLGNFCDR